MYSTKAKAWASKRYQQRLNNGLCPQCGKNRSGDGYITCQACRDKGIAYRAVTARNPIKANRMTNRYRNKCKKNLICYGCGNYVGQGKFKRCSSCRAKSNVINKARYRARYMAGLCPVCGLPNVSEGVLCDTCRERSRLKQLETYTPHAKEQVRCLQVK